MIARQLVIPHAAVHAAVMSEAPSETTRVERSWTSLPSEIIDGGEIIMLAIKPSMWRPLFDSAAWLVVTTILAGMLVVLGRSIFGLSVVASAQVVLAFGGARLVVAIIRWVPTWYVLTNRRVMSIHGVRSPEINSCALIDVRNTYLNTSSPEKLTGLGTITFVSDEPNQRSLFWQSIARPREVHTRIRSAIKNAIDQNGF